MQDWELNFEWPVARYEIRHNVPDPMGMWFRERNPDASPPRIFESALVSVSKPRMRRPSTEELLWGAFKLANSAPETLESDVLEIATKLGMMSGLKPESNRVEEISPLGPWPLVQKLLRRIFNESPRWRGRGNVANLTIYLVGDGSGKLALEARPRNLGEALFFSAARSVASNTASAHKCEYCGAPFLRGGRRQHGIRRADARTCSPKCHKDFNNAKAKKARARK